MNKHYGGVIWTDHAIDRMRERNIKQGDAWAAFMRPDTSSEGKKRGVYVYRKTWPVKHKGSKQSKFTIEIAATKNEKNEWIILSVWSNKATFTKQSHSTYNLLVKLIKEKVFRKFKN